MSLREQQESIKLVVEPGQRPLDDDKSDRPSRLLPVLVGLVIVAALGGVIWYAYGWFGNNSGEDLPVIRAEAGSGKSRPESPGGLEVAHQDKLVLNNPTPDHETPQVERLLPPQEVPKPPLVATKQLAPPPVSSTAPAATAPSASASGMTKPDGAESSGAGLAEPKAPPKTKPRIIATRPLFPTPKEGGQAPAAAPGQLGVPPPPPVSTTPRPQTASRGPAGRYVVQLVSLQAADRAVAAWASLQKTFPKLLGDRTLFVAEVDLGARGSFYRVQAESFENRADAAALCDALKARKQDCLVVKR